MKVNLNHVAGILESDHEFLEDWQYGGRSESRNGVFSSGILSFDKYWNIKDNVIDMSDADLGFHKYTREHEDGEIEVILQVADANKLDTIEQASDKMFLFFMPCEPDEIDERIEDWIKRHDQVLDMLDDPERSCFGKDWLDLWDQGIDERIEAMTPCSKVTETECQASFRRGGPVFKKPKFQRLSLMAI